MARESHTRVEAPPEVMRLVDAMRAYADGVYPEYADPTGAETKELLRAADGHAPAIVREIMGRYDTWVGTLVPGMNGRNIPTERRMYYFEGILKSIVPKVGGGPPELLEALCAWQRRHTKRIGEDNDVLGGILTAMGRYSKDAPLTSLMQQWLRDMRKRWSRGTYRKAWVRRATLLLGEAEAPDIEAGEAWSDRALADLEEMTPSARDAWCSLFLLSAKAGSASPSAAWLKQSEPPLKAIGEKEFLARVATWFGLVEKPRTIEKRRSELVNPHSLRAEHLTILRALCWVAATMPSPELARVFGKLALTCYHKIPGIGPRAVKLGHAAIHGLGQIPGPEALGQLAMLKIKVKFIPAQKMIAKALVVSAERQGVAASELEELGVPGYGFTEVGLIERRLGEHTARLTLSGVGRSEMVFFRRENGDGIDWAGKGGKPAKVSATVPAAVKRDFAAELKEFMARAKDAAAMLAVQRDRIDGLFLADKSWSYAAWSERYLHHPIVGVLARRLIWNIGDGAAAVCVTWLEGAGLVDVAGQPVKEPAAGAAVRLWHPVVAGREDVMAWRRFFEDRGVRQPFKQAHREIYLLTDAERNTGTYSNRFAAHILKQHQFHALAAQRGWKNRLRLMVDDEYPPASRELEPWGLRAEFWVEGASEETTDTGSYLYLSTDQVRFYRLASRENRAHAGGGGYAMTRLERGVGRVGARDSEADELANEPLSLTEIPPLVLSEVLRDVDLFVGVASVANNPAWQDGGPENRYREYWWTHTFGEIGVGGTERKDLLARLLPRLKIGERCSIDGKFLWVRGTKRTYKIHLGSGNILMEPNDEYLCIVPDSRQLAAGSEATHLPFEGDRVLSIILSKAFLLAADEKIRDESIVRQIG